MIAVLAAFQRSGTQALRSILDASKHMHSCGEVFSDRAAQLGELTSFFQFHHALVARQPSLSVPTRNNTRLIWVEYTNHLQRSFPGQAPLLDVKYNSYRHLDCTWLDPLERPHLLSILRKQGARFIHLERRNKRAQALSHLVAHKTGHWYFAPNSPIPRNPASVHIEPQKVKSLADRISKQVQQFRGFLGRYDKVIDLFYEDLLDQDSRLTPSAREKLESGLGIDLPDTAATTRKTPIYNAEWIQNIDELKQITA